MVLLLPTKWDKLANISYSWGKPNVVIPNLEIAILIMTVFTRYGIL